MGRRRKMRREEPPDESFPERGVPGGWRDPWDADEHAEIEERRRRIQAAVARERRQESEGRRQGKPRAQ